MLVIVVTGGAALLLGEPGQPRWSARPDVGRSGSSIDVDGQASSDVRWLHAPDVDGADRRRSTSATWRTATTFPPGHLVEHQATGQPVRVWFATEGAERLAIALEDAEPERAR